MSDTLIQLSASRSRILSTTVLWACVSALLVLLCFVILGRIEYRATGMRSRAVDFSYFVVMLPLGLAALLTSWHTLRSLLLALWPGFVGITFSENDLCVVYGPFKRLHFESKSLRIQYPFEFAEDEMEGHVEAFLPEQVQYETMIPRMQYINGRVRVDLIIQKLLRRSEDEIAQVMRPMIERWCSQRLSE